MLLIGSVFRFLLLLLLLRFVSHGWMELNQDVSGRRHNDDRQTTLMDERLSTTCALRSLLPMVSDPWLALLLQPLSLLS